MELQDYLRIFRARWLGVLLLTVLGGALAFGWVLLQPKVYTAEASGFVSSAAAGGDLGAALVADQAAKAKIPSYVEMGSWRSVADYAIEKLALNSSPQALVKRVTVTNPRDTTIIRVSADAPTPQEARDLAEAWVAGLAAEVDEQLGDGSAGSAGIGISLGESARLPTSPSSPNTRLAVALGLLIGLAAGVGYALVRHSLDRRVRDPRLVQIETGVAVVGSIPLTQQPQHEIARFAAEGSSQAATSSAVTEAMRELRTNLQFMDVDKPPKVIVVTSPLPGDGKSTTAASLAASLAAAGQNTVLVDADLRRPTVHTIFGLPSGAGLTDVIAGRAKFEDLVHPLEDLPGLEVLTAGSIPPNPAEILGSQRMKELIARLSETAMVIIDSPPAIPVTDAVVLSHAADGTLLVITAGTTTYEMMNAAIENITRANGHVIGAVLNKVPQRSSAYYGYRYREEYSA